jgi:hypothetical protein
LFIYDYLREHGETDLTVLRQRFGAGCETALRRMRARGYLQRSVVRKDAAAEKNEAVWSLAIPIEQAQALVECGRTDTWRLTSQKHKNILAAEISRHLRILYDEKNELMLNAHELKKYIEETQGKLPD